jgi:hypothetical protein
MPLTFSAEPGRVFIHNGGQRSGSLDERQWEALCDVWLIAGARELFFAAHDAGVEAGFIPLCSAFRTEAA